MPFPKTFVEYNAGMNTAAKTVSPHIALDERGRPVVAGTRFKVSILVGCHKHWGMSAEQIAESYPAALTKAQIYAALLYYYENQPEMDAHEEQEQAEVEKFFRDFPPKVTRAELLARLASKKNPA